MKQVSDKTSRKLSELKTRLLIEVEKAAEKEASESIAWLVSAGKKISESEKLAYKEGAKKGAIVAFQKVFPEIQKAMLDGVE